MTQISLPAESNVGGFLQVVIAYTIRDPIPVSKLRSVNSQEFDFLRSRKSLFSETNIIHLEDQESFRFSDGDRSPPRLVVVNKYQSYLEWMIPISISEISNADILRQKYNQICNFVSLKQPDLSRRVSESLRLEIDPVWYFSINALITTSTDRGEANAPYIIGEIAEVHRFQDKANYISKTIAGSTGFWIEFSEEARQKDLQICRFWLAKLQIVFASIQVLSELVLKKINSVPQKLITSSQDFDDFIRTKNFAALVALTSAPSANVASWLEIAIYQKGYESWALDKDIERLLVGADRLDGVLQSLETKRQIRNSNIFSFLINIITATGLLSVFSFFYEFHVRHNADVERFLVFESIGITVFIVALIGWITLLFARRN